MVRKKLLLPSDATIKLKQLRRNKTIDLDDGKTRRVYRNGVSFLTINLPDDDFDAFCAQARSVVSIESIDVTVDVLVGPMFLMQLLMLTHSSHRPF